MLSDCVLLFFIAIVTMLLYEKCQAFRYCLKFLLFFVGAAVSATVFIPLMLLKPCDCRNALYPAWSARQISKLLGLKWRMRGHENIIQDEGCVILINHQSFLDLLVLAEIWPVSKNCTVISKKEIFYLWPFGLASWLWGTVFINRSSKSQARAEVNKLATTLKTKKAKICMFPEGTRHGGESLLKFKKGAFHIAIESEVPIQPIVVERYDFLDSKNLRFDGGDPVISILPAVSTKGMKKEDVDSLSEKVYEIMSKEYHSLNAKN